MKNVFLLSATLAGAVFLTGFAQAEVQTETFEYQVDGEDFTGYMAWDDAIDSPRPGILVVHEWWGHNEFARDQARKLADAGYTAMALDLYGSGKLAEHSEDAESFMNAATSDPDAIKARFRKALSLLQEHDTVDADRIAAQGYCFGGTVVLNMARSGMDLDGVVSYHGSLGSPVTAEPGNISARIQVYTGAADPMVPAEQVAGFVEEMHNAEADLMLRSYPGVLHSFTNPRADEYRDAFDMPLGYDEQAANSAWSGTLDFYRELFDQ